MMPLVQAPLGPAGVVLFVQGLSWVVDYLQKASTTAIPILDTLTRQERAVVVIKTACAVLGFHGQWGEGQPWPLPQNILHETAYFFVYQLALTVAKGQYGSMPGYDAKPVMQRYVADAVLELGFVHREGACYRCDGAPIAREHVSTWRNWILLSASRSTRRPAAAGASCTQPCQCGHRPYEGPALSAAEAATVCPVPPCVPQEMVDRLRAGVGTDDDCNHVFSVIFQAYFGVRVALFRIDKPHAFLDTVADALTPAYYRPPLPTMSAGDLETMHAMVAALKTPPPDSNLSSLLLFPSRSRHAACTFLATMVTVCAELVPKDGEDERGAVWAARLDQALASFPTVDRHCALHPVTPFNVSVLRAASVEVPTSADYAAVEKHWGGLDLTGRRALTSLTRAEVKDFVDSGPLWRLHRFLLHFGTWLEAPPPIDGHILWEHCHLSDDDYRLVYLGDELLMNGCAVPALLKGAMADGAADLDALGAEMLVPAAGPLLPPSVHMVGRLAPGKWSLEHSLLQCLGARLLAGVRSFSDTMAAREALEALLLAEEAQEKAKQEKRSRKKKKRKKRKQGDAPPTPSAQEPPMVPPTPPPTPPPAPTTGLLPSGFVDDGAEDGGDWITPSGHKAAPVEVPPEGAEVPVARSRRERVRNRRQDGHESAAANVVHAAEVCGGRRRIAGKLPSKWAVCGAWRAGKCPLRPLACEFAHGVELLAPWGYYTLKGVFCKAWVANRCPLSAAHCIYAHGLTDYWEDGDDRHVPAGTPAGATPPFVVTGGIRDAKGAAIKLGDVFDPPPRPPRHLGPPPSPPLPGGKHGRGRGRRHGAPAPPPPVTPVAAPPPATPAVAPPPPWVIPRPPCGGVIGSGKVLHGQGGAPALRQPSTMGPVSAAVPAQAGAGLPTSVAPLVAPTLPSAVGGTPPFGTSHTAALFSGWGPPENLTRHRSAPGPRPQATALFSPLSLGGMPWAVPPSPPSVPDGVPRARSLGLAPGMSPRPTPPVLGWDPLFGRLEH